MKVINKILLAGVVVMLPFAVMAVDAKKDGKASAGHRWDANKDGIVSKAEFLAGATKQAETAFAKMDTNKDGNISKEERTATGANKGKDKGKGKTAAKPAAPAAKAN